MRRGVCVTIHLTDVGSAMSVHTPNRDIMSKQKTPIKRLKQERNASVRSFDRLENKSTLTTDEGLALAQLEEKISHLDGLIADEKYRQFRSDGSRIKVKESRQYHFGGRYSWAADLAYRTAGAAWGTSGRGGYDINGAEERLARHSHEVAVEVAQGTKEGRRAEASLREWTRPSNDWSTVNDTVKQVRAYGRAAMPTEWRSPMSTAVGSGASLVTPVYLESQYLEYREAGRAFADIVSHAPLPDYGVTVFIPVVGSPAEVAAQVGENQGIVEGDLTTSYLTFDLTTEAASVVLSQQLLDRAGPNFQFDLLVYDQFQRAYNPTIDKFVLALALASANVVTYTASSFELYATSAVDGFVNEVAQAKSLIRTSTNTYCNPTHLVITPARSEFIRTRTDTTGRPQVVDNADGPFNAAGSGNDDYDADGEGPTGYRLASLPVVADSNIPTTVSTNYEQALVLDATQTVFYEGAPVVQALPQTLAQDLSVVLRRYNYVGGYQRRVNAVQTVTGTGLGTSITWSQNSELG